MSRDKSQESLHDLTESMATLLAHRGPDGSGVLRRDAVRAVWMDHLGGRDRHAELWNILMLLSWVEARA